MKQTKILFLTSVILFLLTLTQTASAQIPNDMRNVKAAQISDAQLKDFMKKASESGMSEGQITQEFQSRGMASGEIDIIKSRIASFGSGVATVNNPTGVSDRSVTQGKISYSGNLAGSIFGSELFNTPNLSFEPDLRIPTPKNYVLGPDDKLLLDIYGVNLTQQNLTVSTEGTIALKYAGPIQVNGRTIEEATQLIKNKLTKYYPAISNGGTKLSLTLSGIRTIKVMVLGAAKKPGTYSLTSLATLFNALYVSGGPTDNGSFRKIELIRNDKTILVADLYEFLLKSNQKSNVSLKDNDIIKIPYVKNKINITGEVNREGFYELLSGETLENAINFAGGFKTNAYKATIVGTRITDWDKKMLDIRKDSIQYFLPQDGDHFFIGSIIDKFQNRVSVDGSVYKPGSYALTVGLTVEGLIKKAEGFKEDAFSGRIILIRTKGDLTKEYINLNFNSDSDRSVILKNEDLLKVSSIFDIRDESSVVINGAVRNPGNYIFEDKLTLKSLILQAGGFSEFATTKEIEISRRKKNIEVNNPSSPIIELIKFDAEKDLSKTTSDFFLQPFDIITVKTDPQYKQQISVSISGEVLHPGVYTLYSRTEKISDLIKRAGSLLYTANINGARLIRRNYLHSSAEDFAVADKIAASTAKDSSGTILNEERKPYREVSIALTKIVSSPGSKEDLYLEEGDQIIIPSIDNMVSIAGEVFKPLSINYEQSKKLKEYISDAGGVTKSANKKRIFVIYPNGKAASIKKVALFFNKYPTITAGTKIFVPKEPEKRQIDLAKAGILISAFSALTTGLFFAFQITK